MGWGNLGDADVDAGLEVDGMTGLALALEPVLALALRLWAVF